MKNKSLFLLILGIGSVLLVTSGCVPEHFIIDEYESQKPISILVVPPLNQTPQAEVEDVVYPIFTRAIGQKGYYVYSPEYVRAVFNRNKLEDAGRIHQLSHDKFYDVFGSDAILFITVEDWSAKYYLLGNVITTVIHARMVDAKSGVELFDMRYEYKYDPSAGQSSIAGKLVSAIVSKLGEKSHIIPAARANIGVIANQIPEGQNNEIW